MDQRIAELFDYRDGRLYWRERRGCAQDLGKEAGSVCNGRRYIQIDKKKYLAHRLIFQLHHGYCPAYLDHIDNNPLNNKIENLRPATKQQNAMNRLIRSDNKSGYKGVYKYNNQFRASICVGGRSIHLGSYATPEEAHAAYAEAAAHHFKEFAHV